MTGIAKEYASALFDLTEQDGTQEITASALNMVAEQLVARPEYEDLLASPHIPKQERLSVIEEAFSSCVPERVCSFIQLLCEQGHIRELAQCAQEFVTLWRAKQGISVAKIVSAAPLADEAKERLVQSLEKRCGHRILPEYVCDENLLGGIIVEVDGKVLDGSLRHRLRDVKEVMEQ